MTWNEALAILMMPAAGLIIAGVMLYIVRHQD